jgi:phospholipid/cholesterol/gamma-HCH transport system permease protein
MNVTGQVDAIRALATSPIRVLVVTRLLATMISLPLKAILAAIMGLFGGLLISYFEFNVPVGFYMNKILVFVTFSDILGGVLKCIFFSIVISLLACHRGLSVNEGTTGVGNATTWVVVHSSIVILVSNFFLTKLLIVLFD